MKSCKYCANVALPRKSRCRVHWNEYQRAYMAAHPQYRGAHREHNKDRRKKRIDIVRAAKDKPCMDCGEQHPHYVMEFDHRDPTTKKFNVADHANRALDDIRKEIDKCDVVCANCHRKRTFGNLLIGRKSVSDTLNVRSTRTSRSTVHRDVA